MYCQCPSQQNWKRVNIFSNLCQVLVEMLYTAALPFLFDKHLISKGLESP